MKIGSKLTSLVFPLFLVISLSMTGCASKKKSTEDAATAGAESSKEGEGAGLGMELYADSDSGKAGALKTVYFAYDSSELTSDGKDSLNSNADFLKKEEKVKIQVEGHCDERGGVQYNLALGERRAKSIKEYLTALGVSSNRISTISYGKERPLEASHDEEAWSKNRRGNFVITEK